MLLTALILFLITYYADGCSERLPVLLAGMGLKTGVKSFSMIQF